MVQRHTHIYKPLSRNGSAGLLRLGGIGIKGSYAEAQIQQRIAKRTCYSSCIPTIPLLEKRGRKHMEVRAPRACLCRSKETSPVSSWQWCWLVNLWMEPRPHLVPSHCEPPASALLSTDPLPPWKHNYVVRKVVAASFIISSPAWEGFGL